MRIKRMFGLIFRIAFYEVLMALPEIFVFFNIGWEKIFILAPALLIIYLIAEHYCSPKIREPKTVNRANVMNFSVLFLLMAINRELLGTALEIVRFAVIPLLLCLEDYFNYGPL